jgi:hypothetical protein
MRLLLYLHLECKKHFMESKKAKSVVYQLLRTPSKIAVVSKEINKLQIKDLRTGKIKSAVLSKKPMVNGSSVSLVYKITPNKGRRNMSDSQDFKEKYKFLSVENYDPEAVKRYQQETGETISPDFRLDINDDNSLIVTVKDNFDRAALQNMSDEEQLAVLKSLQAQVKRTPRP